MNSSRPSKVNFGGMTVNERLFVAGKQEVFDEAILLRSREKMVTILTDLDMKDEQASATVDAILKNPSMYDSK